jgi:uncharacterized delta-60 repeat protein
MAMRRPTLYVLFLAVSPLAVWSQNHNSEAASMAKSGGGSCSAPTVINPPVLVTACSSAAGQACLDATFGNSQPPPGGLVLTNTDGTTPSNDLVQAVKTQQQPDGTLRLVAIGSGSQNSVALARYNLDGSLDTTFGSGGITKFLAPVGGANVFEGAVDSNGNILALQSVNSQAVVSRFTPSGTLDATFNSSGYAVVPSINVWSMLLQPDGKILVGGGTTGRNEIGLVARLNHDGSLDTAFGSNGQVTTSLLLDGRALGIQWVNSIPYILLGGQNSSGNFSVVRITPGGAVDTTFGVSGAATLSFCGFGGRVYSLAVDSSGDILAGGYAIVTRYGNTKLVIARFTPSGAPDTTFGDVSSSSRTGYAVRDYFGGQNNLSAVVPVVDSAGNEVALLASESAFETVVHSTYKYTVVAQFHPDGSADSNFAANGAVAITWGNANSFTISPGSSNLLVQPDGKIVVGTGNGLSSGYDFALARLWP